MNEAEAVNAQRDAQRAGEMGTILDTSVRLGAYTFSDALWPQNATTLNVDVKKFTANIYRNLNAKYEVGHPIAKEWEQPDPITSPVRSLHEMGRGKSADRPEYPVDLPDCFRVLEGYRERIAYLERQRDAAASARANALERIAALERQRDELKALLEESREVARAEAARHAGRLIVAAEERDAATAALAAVTDERDALRSAAHSTLRGHSARVPREKGVGRV